MMMMVMMSDHNDDLVGHDRRMQVDNDGHCGDDGNEESNHNDDDNLVEHDLPPRRMEVDCKNNPSQLPIK